VVGVYFPASGEASPNARVIAVLEPVILNDTRLGPLRLKQELYNVPAILSWMGVPLVFNERPIGMITLDKYQTNFYTQAHAQTALAYAAQAAIVLENVRLYQDLHTQMQVLQATQAQLVQSERMAALGRLMASIAHEINNPLQAVQGVLGLLGEELEGSRRQEKIGQYLYVANGEIERIAGIVHRMRDFYRPTRPQSGDETGDFYRRLPPTAVATAELPSILESVFLLVNKKLQHGKITIEQILDPALPPLPISPDHLKQVFLNLTLNAIDAMAGQGGTLRVCALPDKARLTGSRAQRVVRIEFSDTGMGMPAEVISRLFEPLFSTKEHGSGFGLFTSYQIIQAYEGQISATSEEGRGTSFTILLPVKTRSVKPLT
jgi:two-component system NtrC family sensor kinase